MNLESIAVRSCRSHAGRGPRLGVTPSVAAARPPSAKGSISCFVTGTLTARPALTMSSGKATTLTLHATFRGCTGSSAATKVTGGTLTGKSVETHRPAVWPSRTASHRCPGQGHVQDDQRFVRPDGTRIHRSDTRDNANAARNPSPRAAQRARQRDRSRDQEPKLILDMPIPYSQWVTACEWAGLATMTITSESSLTA